MTMAQPRDGPGHITKNDQVRLLHLFGIQGDQVMTVPSRRNGRCVRLLVCPGWAVTLTSRGYSYTWLFQL